MATTEKDRLPNLKICIDNAESGAEDDELSLNEETDIDIADTDGDRRIATRVSPDRSAVVSVSDHADDIRQIREDEPEVQFNVLLNKVEPKPIEASVPSFRTGVCFRIKHLRSHCNIYFQCHIDYCLVLIAI